MLSVTGGSIHPKGEDMRCPKCGFISFDHLETCKKCLKYIGDIDADINGTTYDATAPLFLKIASSDQEADSLSVQREGEKDIDTLFDGEGVFELGESTENEFALDQGVEPALQRKEIEFPQMQEVRMELDDLSEISPREEFTLDLGEQSDDLKSPLPSVDFGDLDISDLAPPIQEESEPIHFEEQLVLSDLEPVATLSQPHPSPPSPPPSKSQSGLEDLHFNGLDLDTPSKLVSGSAAGKRYLPSVKTGTALDKFDIDLGDLFSENKK